MSRTMGGPNLRAVPPLPATRRTLLGTMGAALLLVAPAAGEAKAAELDGPLLAAIATWEPWERERHAVEALTADDPTYSARFATYAGPWHEHMRNIMDLPARTPEGVHGKIRVLRALLHNHAGYGDGLHEGSSPSEDFAWALCRDVLGRAGV